MTLFHKNSIKNIFLKFKIYLDEGNFIFVSSNTDEWVWYVLPHMIISRCTLF